MNAIHNPLRDHVIHPLLDILVQPYISPHGLQDARRALIKLLLGLGAEPDTAGTDVTMIAIPDDISGAETIRMLAIEIADRLGVLGDEW